MSLHRPAAQADDIPLPMPPHLAQQPNPGACWRSECARELARQDAAAAGPPPLNHTASAALLADAGDRTAPGQAALPDVPGTPHAAYELGVEVGQAAGLRHGWLTGVAWGVICGAVATVGMIGALVVVFAMADNAPEVHQVILQGTLT